MDRKNDAAQEQTTVVVNFRASPEDATDLKSAAEQQRTSVSSLVRGALLQVGLFKNKSEEVAHATVR